jgi:hypothetical protein
MAADSASAAEDKVNGEKQQQMNLTAVWRQPGM